MERRYLVLPGRVFSQNDQNDHDDHFIGAAQLMRLYGVRPQECVVGELETHGHWSKAPRGMDASGLIELKPDYFGEYRLPDAH